MTFCCILFASVCLLLYSVHSNPLRASVHGNGASAYAMVPLLAFPLCTSAFVCLCTCNGASMHSNPLRASVHGNGASMHSNPLRAFVHGNGASAYAMVPLRASACLSLMQ